jgi:hypothetical protein
LVGAGNGTGYMVDGAAGTLFRLNGTTQTSIDTWGLGRISMVGAGNGVGYMTVKNPGGTAAHWWYLNGGTGGGGQEIAFNLPAGEFLDHLVGAGNGIGYMAETLTGKISRLDGTVPSLIDTWGPDRVLRLVGAGTGTAYHVTNNGAGPLVDKQTVYYLNGGGGQDVIFNEPAINNLVGAGSDNAYYDVGVGGEMLSVDGTSRVLYDTWGSGSITSLVGGIESGGFAYMVRNNGQIWQIGGTTTAGEVLLGTFAPGEIGEVIGLSDGTALYTISAPTEIHWNANSGDWNDSANWVPTIVPNTNAVVAVFGLSIVSSETVFTDLAVTAKGIRFNNINSFAIAGTGSVNLEADVGNAGIDVELGDHQFQAIVNLNSEADVDVAAGSTLIFNGALNVGANNLNKTGDGTLQINSALNTGGGAVSASAGVISGSGLVSGDLNNNGATVAPGNSPGTLSVGGNYTQTASGTLATEIAGSPGSGLFDVLAVTGNAVLDGILDISLLSFNPATNDMFTVLTTDTGTISGLGNLTLTGDMAGDFMASLANSDTELVLTFTGVGVNADFDLDGDVDGNDFLEWQRTDGTSGGLTLWQNNYGTGALAAASTASVPEPASVSLLAVALCGLGCGWRKRFLHQNHVNRLQKGEAM